MIGPLGIYLGEENGLAKILIQNPPPKTMNWKVSRVSEPLQKGDFVIFKRNRVRKYTGEKKQK